MKNAILITGGPATGKNILALLLADAIAPDRRAWLLCPRASALEPRPETRLVIADEIASLKTLAGFLPYLGRGPLFFILVSQRVRSLPPGSALEDLVAHFALSGYCEGRLSDDGQHGGLPEQVTNAIRAEMQHRRATHPCPDHPSPSNAKHHVNS